MSAEQFDNELFNLSQQADDANAMPFNEEAWQRMEQLLDGDKKKRGLVLWWWLLPLLLMGGGGAFYINSSSNSGNKISVNSKINQLPITTNKIESNDIIKENKVVIEEDTTNKKVEFNSKNRNTIGVAAQTEQVAKQTIVAVKTTNKYQSVKIKQLRKGNVDLMASQWLITKNSIGSKGVDNNPNTGKKNIDNTVNGTTVVTNNSDSIKQEIVVADKVAEVKEIVKEKTIGTDTITTSPVKSATKKTKASFLSKFEVSAFVSADATTASFNYTDKKSLAYGIGLGYQLSKKLSIATGFGISRKLYSADSANYKNPPSIATTYKLKSVDANCLVYELPINLQYQFAQGKKSSWLAVGGISTYFMKSEAYDYNYLWYGQARKTSYLIEDKNNHLFSILNLAIGYRRQFTKQLSYQLSPFIKVPLTGIGEGKVNLYSAGLQLSVHFNR